MTTIRGDLVRILKPHLDPPKKLSGEMARHAQSKANRKIKKIADEVESLVEKEMGKCVGWTHAYCTQMLNDKGSIPQDPREVFTAANEALRITDRKPKIITSANDDET